MQAWIKVAVAAALGSALAVAGAQTAGSDDKMRGDMGDHPHQQATPGSKRPMSRDKEDPRMRGDMGDHPHQQATPGSKRSTSRDKEDPRMRGAMPDHPHTPSTTGQTSR